MSLLLLPVAKKKYNILKLIFVFFCFFLFLLCRQSFAVSHTFYSMSKQKSLLMRDHQSSLPLKKRQSAALAFDLDLNLDSARALLNYIDNFLSFSYDGEKDLHYHSFEFSNGLIVSFVLNEEQAIKPVLEEVISSDPQAHQWLFLAPSNSTSSLLFFLASISHLEGPIANLRGIIFCLPGVNNRQLTNIDTANLFNDFKPIFNEIYKMLVLFENRQPKSNQLLIKLLQCNDVTFAPKILDQLMLQN